ncbi:hypothetical protein FQR65_LT17311 [Abscondita terminalis]|nr:hypothetical protein FQR65_LT17311 [Abscondita terminalis]
MGQQLAMPIGIAPTALQKLAHPIGEGATVRAAQEKNVIFILSMYSTTSIEEISEIAPSAIKWFQMCVYKNREVNRHLIQRAEKAGFKAIVLTADTPVVGLRYSEARNKFSLPSHLKFENLEGLRKLESENGLSLSDLEYVPNNLNASFTWEDLKWFQSITKLPIILKGILTAEDAVTAADKGVAAIIVSNHGARQLDSAPATIEALPRIVKAVGERIDVFVDGGFRTGVDVFKASGCRSRGLQAGVTMRQIHNDRPARPH